MSMPSQTESPLRVDILGVGISVTSQEATVAEIARWIERDVRQYVCVTNVHAVMECQRDPHLLHIHNCSGLTVPDGKPILWGSRYAGAKVAGQVRGADLMLAVNRMAADHGWPVFFYGGRPGTAELLAGRLRGRIPHLKIAGTYSPPFRAMTARERNAATQVINESGAKIVWVGLSAPKQEYWMAEQRPALTAPVLVGVGAAFDFHAGLKREAPRWMQRVGLEWLFRLTQEPTRLAGRYARTNPGFVLGLLRCPPRLRNPATLERG